MICWLFGTECVLRLVCQRQYSGLAVAAEGRAEGAGRSLDMPAPAANRRGFGGGHGCCRWFHRFIVAVWGGRGIVARFGNYFATGLEGDS